MRSLFLLLGLVASLILAGCGTPPERRLEAPSLGVAGLKSDGAQTVLTLRFVNPNTVPLAVESSTHTLYIGSARIGRIEDKVPVGIPPVGGVTHSVTVPPELASAITALLAKSPSKPSLVVESALEIAISGSDTMTLNTTGAGSLK